MGTPLQRVWLFDLDNTLHNAGHAAFGLLEQSIGDYIARELRIDREAADQLRRRYWQRYGATLLGLVRHHGVEATHFLHHTHLLPGLEAQLHAHPHDIAALRRLHGTKYVLTNAPLAYARRVLKALGIARCFDGVIAIDHMRAFGQLRPKPDARMFRVVLARLQLPASHGVLVEDTLAHQRAARRVGLRTVWMQRWLASKAPGHGPEVGVYLHRKPAYVCDRIRTLADLPRLFTRRQPPE